jgi:hypothetical protein
LLTLLKRVVFFALKPAWWLVLRILPAKDPWERLNVRVALEKYGAGARHDFAWDFEGESAVTVATVEDVQGWLAECAYVHDPALFREDDFWQHPLTFEKLRQGDCEDHAIWAWRKLVELGVDADLVCGRLLPWDPVAKDGHRGHAWVVFRAANGTFLFETVEKKRERMVRPLAEVCDLYRPEFGVDSKRKRFAFNGMILSLREREFGVELRS